MVPDPPVSPGPELTNEQESGDDPEGNKSSPQGQEQSDKQYF